MMKETEELGIAFQYHVHLSIFEKDHLIKYTSKIS